ncbi:hypothetical protein E2C01_078630 [Portunus trituberculatus]|uniref:Uncharacterized protein n=1 Tax=Portunus trituberculatus TaxID=210409 RepID=A0A5B7IP97_PORTR|nr:hypothetical protein [Portunus trituberculatus]
MKSSHRKLEIQKQAGSSSLPGKEVFSNVTTKWWWQLVCSLGSLIKSCQVTCHGSCFTSSLATKQDGSYNRDFYLI